MCVRVVVSLEGLTSLAGVVARTVILVLAHYDHYVPNDDEPWAKTDGMRADVASSNAKDKAQPFFDLVPLSRSLVDFETEICIFDIKTGRESYSKPGQ